MSFFEVDKEGLAKIAGRRGKAYVLYELLQNAWDAPGVNLVKVDFQPEAGRPFATLTVEDDSPEGFRNLAHAWTLFAESEKKGDATKRGRFNFGEKLVLALCKEAEIITTTGSVRFDDTGRHTGRKKLSHGSVFTALVRMTREEYNEALREVRKVIPPVGTYINGERLPMRKALGTQTVTLLTEISDEEGHLRRVKRQTEVNMYAVGPDETGLLYELGIPVMETGDKFHVDVQQKVPLTMERDGVHPSYLRAVRAATLNALWSEIRSTEDATAPWVRDAISSPDITSRPVLEVMNKRFGIMRVIHDPSDPEANNIAASQGYTVISGGSLSAEEWQNVKRFEAAYPAGKMTPSPKPFHPDGEQLKLIESLSWTPATVAMAKYFEAVTNSILGHGLMVKVANDPDWNFNGCFAKGDICEVTVNYAKLRAAIEGWDLPVLNRFLIHELAHFFEDNHLAEGFHKACCELGGEMVSLALQNPDLFQRRDQ